MPHTRAQSSFQGRDYSIGFFADPATRSALNAIASCDSLVIWCGAGISIDQRLPSWASLVEAVMATGLTQCLGISREGAKKLAKSELRQHGESASATMADALLTQAWGTAASTDRDALIQELLYPGGTRPYLAPSLAEEILVLAHALKIKGKAVTIITTNYDDLLEWIVRHVNPITQRFQRYGFRLTPYGRSTPPDEPPVGEIPVLHIHGYLPRRTMPQEQRTPTTFSEADYASWPERSSLGRYLDGLLSRSSVLIIGSSLRDETVMRRIYLQRRSPETSSVALVPLQGESRKTARQPPAIWEAHANLMAQRGAQLNMVVLRPDFFGEVGQFLNEVAAAVSHNAYQYFTERLSAWQSWWTEERAGQAGQAISERCIAELRKLAADVTSEFAGVSHAKVELWVRTQGNPPAAAAHTHSIRELGLWASSQSIPLIDRHYWPKVVPLDVRELLNYAAVNAFALQTSAFGRVRTEANRWTHYLAAPLVYASEQTRLPLGAAVLFVSSPEFTDSDVVPTLESAQTCITNRLLELGRSFTVPDQGPQSSGEA